MAMGYPWDGLPIGVNFGDLAVWLGFCVNFGGLVLPPGSWRPSGLPAVLGRFRPRWRAQARLRWLALSRVRRPWFGTLWGLETWIYSGSLWGLS